VKATVGRNLSLALVAFRLSSIYKIFFYLSSGV
jgi:hypothetical protein